MILITKDFQHMIQLTQLLFHMGNNAQCNVTEISTTKIKTHDGVVSTLSNVRHIPNLKGSLISLGILESRGYKYSVEGGVMKVYKRT